MCASEWGTIVKGEAWWCGSLFDPEGGSVGPWLLTSRCFSTTQFCVVQTSDEFYIYYRFV